MIILRNLKKKSIFSEDVKFGVSKAILKKKSPSWASKAIYANLESSILYDVKGKEVKRIR